MKLWIREIRVHQWAKNLLIFVAYLLSWKFDLKPIAGAGGQLTNLVFAFFGFSFTASAVYVLNDIVDLQSDKQHPEKRYRPIASGAIKKWDAALGVLVLLCVGLACGSVVGLTFLVYQVAYLALTTVYTVSLKRVAWLDVIVLAALYTMRVVVGGVVSGTPISFWLLLFSTFTFLSLALAKRYAEVNLNVSSKSPQNSKRDYSHTDLGVLLTSGIAASFASVMTFAFFLNSPQSVVHYPGLTIAWITLGALVYFSLRIWSACSSGAMHHDPLVFAFRDAKTLAAVAIGTAALVSSHYLILK